MFQRLIRPALLACLLVSAVLISACGTVATPEWAAEAQATEVAQLATADHLTAIAPTATFTRTPVPSSTPVPPIATATPLPPTATATEVPATATPLPTEPPAPVAPAGPSGDAASGQAIFNQVLNTAQGPWSCAMCHSVTPDELRLIGPGLWNVPVRAETRVEGEDAYAYIRHSILAPNDFIVPPDALGAYPPGLMPQNYQELLTEQQLEDVITYLFTLQ